MKPFLEVYWKSGDVRIMRLPEPETLSRDGSEIVQLEQDICYSAEKGLWIEYRHHAAQTQEVVPGLGLECEIKADYFTTVLSAKDLANVVAVNIEGEPFLIEITGELVDVTRLSRLSALYLNYEAEGALLMQIACLAEAIAHNALSDTTGLSSLEASRQLAETLGITVEVLQAARDFKAQQDAENPDSEPDPNIDTFEVDFNELWEEELTNKETTK